VQGISVCRPALLKKMHGDSASKLHSSLDLDVLHLSIVCGAGLGGVVQGSAGDSVVLQVAGLGFAVF